MNIGDKVKLNPENVELFPGEDQLIGEVITPPDNIKDYQISVKWINGNPLRCLGKNPLLVNKIWVKLINENTNKD